MSVTGQDHERREQLLEHIPIAIEHQAGELENVMGDQVKIKAILHPGCLDGLLAYKQAHNLLNWEDVDAPYVPI